MAEQTLISILPGSFTEGGGLLDDVDAVISDARFIMTDYEGTMDSEVPVCQIGLTVDGEETMSLYSVGGNNDFIPSEDGMALAKVGGKNGLNKSSKFAMFMLALVEAGCSPAKLEPNNIGCLVGLEGHFDRMVVEYKGMSKRQDKDGKPRDNTVLVCTNVTKAPWDVNAAPKAAKGAAKGKKAAACDEDALATIIQDIIIEADGTMAKKEVLSSLFKSDALKEREDRAACLKLAKTDKFLGGREEWNLDDVGVMTV